MFLASKLLSFATQPLAWVAFLLMAGLLCMPVRRQWGMRLSWLALAVLLLQGWIPLPDALLRHLEAQYVGPAPQDNLQGYAGVVVLGGALEPSYVWQAHTQVALNDAAERMTVPVALLQKYPHWRLLFTGGEGELFADGLTEADRAKIFFDSMGVAPQRVLYESASHTTYENAVLSATVPGVNSALPWLLLTSASHMPRAMATFRKAGWNVTPYPVDFRTGAQTPWTQYALAVGANKWHLALHELLGLLAYRLAGRA
ncbi:MAG: YdcF family protein [Pseudomonadota bacterium]